MALTWVDEPGASETLDIGFLMSSLGLVRGGMETQARHLAAGLVERGHRVTIVTGWSPRPAVAQLPGRTIEVACLPAPLRLWYPLAARRPGWPLKAQSLSFAFASGLHPQVRQLIRRADVTMTFFEIETVLFSTWRERCGRPNLSYFPGGISWRWLRRDRSIVRVALSQTMADRYRDVTGFNIDGVILPGVPGEWLEHPYHVRTAVRTLVFVGRLEANKGVVELLRIFEGLAATFPDLRLRVLGDGPLRGTVESRAARSGLAHRVTFLGSVPTAQVAHELREADLFVFPSRYESLPTAVLEAQAVGVPVVGSDLPGIREAVGVTGRLVRAEDVDGWIQAIDELIRDRDQRERMSRAGRRRARGFKWHRAAEELECYLRLAINRSPGQEAR